MSADSCYQCPKCRGIDPALQAELKDKEKALEKAYGTVDSKEYLKLVAEFKKASKELPKEGDDECLPSYEDHYFDDNEGVFHVSFSMECYVCGWTFSHVADIKYDD